MPIKKSPNAPLRQWTLKQTLFSPTYKTDKQCPSSIHSQDTVPPLTKREKCKTFTPHFFYSWPKYLTASFFFSLTFLISPESFVVQEEKRNGFGTAKDLEKKKCLCHAASLQSRDGKNIYCGGYSRGEISLQGLQNNCLFLLPGLTMSQF